MTRRAILVVALLFAIVGGLSGAQGSPRKSCDVTEIGIGRIVISTKPICILPCIHGQPLCAAPPTQSSASGSAGIAPGAGH